MGAVCWNVAFNLVFTGHYWLSLLPYFWDCRSRLSTTQRQSAGWTKEVHCSTVLYVCRVLLPPSTVSKTAPKVPWPDVAVCGSFFSFISLTITTLALSRPGRLGIQAKINKDNCIKTILRSFYGSALSLEKRRNKLHCCRTKSDDYRELFW